MDEVWVALTWEAHGYGTRVFGAYGSREAAFEALKALPNMTVYVDAAGEVRGRPRKERSPGMSLRYWMNQPPERWAHARPVKVESRQPITQAE
jgi:hypothetical protein